MVSSKEKIKIFIHQLWFELEQNEDAWDKVHKYGSASNLSKQQDKVIDTYITLLEMLKDSDKNDTGKMVTTTIKNINLLYNLINFN